jgi:multidrug efflux pump subunit AcrA (membrane-fusion protein)
MTEKIRGWIRSRPILWTAATGLVALLVGAGIGASDTQDDEIADLEGQLSAETDRADSAEAEADRWRERAVAAKVEADDRVTRAQQEIRARLEEELSDREAAVAEAEQEVEAARQEVEAAQQTLEANTIPDGIWQLGRDYEAGLYRAPGGAGCYWAELREANTNAIIDNGFGGQNQTVTIDSPFFETSDCGEWVLID